MLPALYRRFADIANGRVGFVFTEERLTELLHFVPQENTAGTQLFIKLKDQLRVADIHQLCCLVVRLESPQNLVRFVVEIEYKCAGLRLPRITDGHDG